MRRPKIAFVGGFFPFQAGGAEYQSYLLACKLRERAEISFVYIDDDSRPPFLSHDGFSLLRIPKRRVLRRVAGRYFVLDMPCLLEVLSTIQPDIIYRRGGTAYSGIASMYARRRNCKMILHISSDRDVASDWYRGTRTAIFDYLDHRFMKYAIQNAHSVIGQTYDQSRKLESVYGRQCTCVVGNWHPLPKEDIVKRENPVTVVWIANVKSMKRPELFMALAAELAHLSSVRFVMVGRPPSGTLASGFRKEIQSTGKVDFRGEMSIDEVSRLLAASHILVNTSLYEGFPNTFVQAWMHYVPVVSLQVDPDDVLRKEKIGFHSGTFDNLVRDTKNLIENENVRRQMGERARHYALQNHVLETAIGKILHFFEPPL